MSLGTCCRNAMIEARVRRLPGYVEVESYKERGPGARLRRYASRLVGDMQPARASMSDTDDEAMVSKIWEICRSLT